MARYTHGLVVVVALSGVLAAHASEVSDTAPILVQVKKQGELIKVDAEFTVAVSPRQAWEVLTDFDHMARFISNVQDSRITARDGNTWQVTQKGAAKSGPFHFSFDSVREIRLTPMTKIDTRLLSGSMKQLNGTTVLSPDGSATRIVYHADSIPGTFVPPVIGTRFIASESQQQFEEFRREMLKRSLPSKE